MGVHFGTADFIYFKRKLTAELLTKVVAQLFDFHTLATDDNTGAGSGQDKPYLAASTFDFNLGNACMIQELFHERADLAVFIDKGGVIFLAEPTGQPVLVIPKPEPERMYFLTHSLFLPFCEYNGDVARALVNLGRPALGTGHEALPGGAFVDHDFLHHHGVHINAAQLRGIRQRAFEHTVNNPSGLIGRKAQKVHCLLHSKALHVFGDKTGLARRNALEFRNSFRFHIATLLPAGLSLFVGGMPMVGTGGREFAQLVTNHVFGDEHRHELFAIMHRKGQSHHFGQDGRAARPGLDHAPIAVGHGGVDLLHQMTVNKRPFFQ
ncbi:hypothetical protein KL86DES1_10990 [uncultured Desulfovibrio sp.]|uniref:Uncharacterized protein n=1 Tax=uncultured Desulfovibrio sp. TaxID=167968 RepID=A0A212L175_9BACT|nr:hypothetical protein KL86DES1_10990 [uncultured Desulfovibrio sp.]